jgi:hypothetical protein
VLVVVVVSDTCAHANGATIAIAILNIVFFMFSPFVYSIAAVIYFLSPEKFRRLKDLPLNKIRMQHARRMFAKVFSVASILDLLNRLFDLRDI